MRTEHLIGLAVPLTYVAMVCTELLGSGKRWPSRRGWELIGIACFAMIGLINASISGWAGRWFPDQHLWEGDVLGIVLGAMVAYGIISIANAVMHRAYHRYDVLWRWVHQIHHAPSRITVAGVMIQSPVEIALNAVLFVVVTRFLFGLGPVATMLCAYIATVVGMFQHWNVHTPRWIGLIIQRPESHSTHHHFGVHAGNYSDVPLWDMVWGTFSNPREFVDVVGFAAPARERVWAMLSGHDVNASE